MTEPRDRTRIVMIEKTIHERCCDACDDWFRLTKPNRLYCSNRCQRIAYHRRRRALHSPA